MMNGYQRVMRILLTIGLMSMIATTAADEVDEAALREAIAKRLPGIKATSLQIRPGPFPGLFEVTHGHEIVYVSPDGRFLLQGEIVDLQTRRNLTEDRRAIGRRAALEALGEANMIVFSPASKPKHTITVFTDIDCGFCRKLHQEIAQYNEQGIRVRYVFFPRAGIGSESWQKAQDVWCAKDRRDAITRAKRGEPIPHAECPTPVAREYELGLALGVSGTPAIITEHGYLIGGYLPLSDMVREIERLARLATVSGQTPAASR